MAHYWQSSILTFEQFFASIDEIFILGGRLCTRLKFSEDLRSYYFLISEDPKS